MEYNGARDTRTAEEKKKDWQHEELFGSSSPVVWSEDDGNFKVYSPIRNQDGSGACGGFSGNIALGINEFYDNGTFVALSPAYIYTNRKNKDSEGMELIDLMTILTTLGSFPDPDLKSDNLNEQQINALTFTTTQKKQALKYRGKNYLFAPKDIDTVADLIQKGYAPIFLLRCMGDEYTEYPQVKYGDRSLTNFYQWNINHYIVGTGYGMKNGKKYISVQESWGVGALPKGLRYFSEEFLRDRVQLVVYVIDLKTEETDKPELTFATPLSFGARSEEVKKLQEMLRYEQFFPSNVDLTGYFGIITARALRDWQVKHGIMDFAKEKDLTKVRFGNKSITEANKLYSL